MRKKVNPSNGYEEMSEWAITLFANPHRILAKGTFQKNHAVIKIAFSDSLAYSRKTGLRTPKTSIPFKALGIFNDGENKMVRPAGLEPAASRLEVSRSIQMSYGRTYIPHNQFARLCKAANVIL